jgi:squalene-hopene/tetraprenyl-beta-curcumene cyclase
LLRQQRPDGAWNAYWWHGDIYATALSILALHQVIMQKIIPAAESLSIARDKAVVYLLEAQQVQGGWVATPKDPPCPFQTGLALQALATSAANRAAIQAGITFLHQTQESNGCWRAQTGIMRLPAPEEEKPWQASQPWPLGTTIGSLVPDQNRVFTTATVVAALYQVTNINQFQDQSPALIEVSA